MTDIGKRLEALIETASAGASGNGEVANAVLDDLESAAERGDVEAYQIIRWMARDGVVAQARRWRARSRITVQIGEVAFRMRRYLGVRRESGFQTVMWQLMPVLELREYREWLRGQINVASNTLTVIDFGIELAEKHGTATARDALIAKGLNPDEFTIGAAA